MPFSIRGAESVVLVREDSLARAFVPTDNALGNLWTGGQPFDDSDWLVGQQGVGYSGPGDQVFFQNTRLFLLAQMHSISPTAFIRIPFNVADAQSVTTLVIRARYDDGLVAFINGTRVWGDGPAGDGPFPWDTTVPSRLEPQSSFYETHDITASIDLLHDGLNLFAIHGFNNSAASQDFFIQTELIATVVPEPDAACLALAFSATAWGAIRHRRHPRSLTHVMRSLAP